MFSDRIIIVAVFLTLSAVAAIPQSNPGFVDGNPLCSNYPNTRCQPPTKNPLSLNGAFIGKLDYPPSPTVIPGVNPVWFGADPFGSVDSTIAINNAIAAGTTGYASEKQVYISFPPGFFKIESQISIDIGAAAGSVRINGAGPLLTTLWFPNANTGIVVDLGTNPSTAAHVRDMSFATSGAGTSTGLMITSSTPQYNIPITDLTNLDFLGLNGYGQGDFWLTAVIINGVSNSILTNVNVYGGGAICAMSLSNVCGTGILIKKNGTAIANAIYINTSSFYYLTNGINLVGDVEGIGISQTNFLDDSIGILGSGNGTNTDFALQWNIGPANAFNDFINDIKIANNIVGALTINENLFLVINNSVTSVDIVGITSVPVNSSVIFQNNFIDCTTTSGTTGLYLGAGQFAPVMVAGNVFTGCGAGVHADTGSSLISINNNGFSHNATAILNTGTQNVIIDNVGYNPVGVTSAVYTPPTTATYTAGPSPETHYLTGGTVSAVKVPNNTGAVVCSTTPCQVNLGPNETFSVTYSGAPTDTVSIH